MRSRYTRTAMLILGLMAWMRIESKAQIPPVQTVSPFDIVGFIDAATLTAAADGFSGGGTITVNGTVVTVPANTLLQMPAFALTWQEVFTQAPAPWGPTQSGMARADRDSAGNPPLTTYEVHIQGNRVNAGGSDQYIAGLMFLSQQSLNAGAGFINFIDYATGELYVGGAITSPPTPNSGARVVINDPTGKFGRVRSHDVRFTIDEDNPTVRTETGYPMCVPRVAPGTDNGDGTVGDALCPENNRPTGSDGHYLTIFTTDFPPGWEFLEPSDGSYVPNGTNALVMAPFEIGDYVNYNGNLVIDANGPYISAWGVIDNIGLFTAAGTQPTYVAIDVMLLGTGGVTPPGLPQEAAVRTRIEGFTTDPSSFIMLSAVDVDPCTAQESDRFYDMVAVDPGPPASRGGVGAVAGRWRWRPSADAPFLPPTRMLRATSTNGAYVNWDTGEMKTPAGLAAGLYTAPNFEFIFPENLGIGNAPVPNNFQDFPFLANGSGAYLGVSGSAVPLGTLGQLTPWPGAPAPATPLCPADGGPAVYTPIADAGPAQSVARGATVTIDAGNSRDTTAPVAMPLTYTWTQVVANPAQRITLPAGFSAPSTDPQRTFQIATFVNNANIPVGTVLTFQVVVDNGTATSSSTMTISVVASPTPVDTLTAATAIFRIKRSRLDVAVTTSDATAVLTVLGFGEMGPALPVATGVPAPLTDRLYRQVGVNPPPANVAIRSSSGGTVTVPVTVRP
jgi:hypothetical protein